MEFDLWPHSYNNQAAIGQGGDEKIKAPNSLTGRVKVASSKNFIQTSESTFLHQRHGRDSQNYEYY